MARRMIKIEPGTESWDAWLRYHRGTKVEMNMLLCAHRGEPFNVWTAMPPETVKGSGVQLPQVHASVKASHVTPAPAEGDIGRMADRLEARADRDAQELTAEDARLAKLRRIDALREKAQAAVQIGNKPNVKELDDVGIRMVEDPYELKQGRKPKPLRAKLVNLRDDPVGQMAKRDQITGLQLEAARSWQALHDVAASVGLTGGLDPFAVKVSGGKMAEPINDVQIHAMKELQSIDMRLGFVGAVLVRQVLGDRMTVAQAAELVGKPCNSDRERQTERERLGWRLRECLDTLVDILGLKVKGRGKRDTRRYDAMAAAPDVAQYANNPELYRAVRDARRKIV